MGGQVYVAIMVALGVPFVTAGVLWALGRLLVASGGVEDGMRNVPDEPNRQGRTIPGRRS